ncbi:hypothetical protein AAQ05_005378 [Salmonella enterica subsp. diarizonae]|nr:hypothetical protein [Salmonella enterica subsp. diarizonae]
MNNKQNEATRTNGKRLLTQKEVGDFLNYVFSPDSDYGNQKRNRLMRFTCGVQTAQHQANRALDLAQDGQWLLAMEFLNVCSRTVDNLKRVAREVPPAANEEKQS